MDLVRPTCFGCLSCPEDYNCPCVAECTQALFDEIKSVPLESWKAVQKVWLEEKRVAPFLWKERAKR